CMKRIKKWCRTYDEMGCFTYKDKPRSGRPRKLTDEMINDVVQWRTCSETATTKQKTNPECAALLSEKYEVGVCRETIGNYVKEKGFRYGTRFVSPPLTDEHNKQRLRYA